MCVYTVLMRSCSFLTSLFSTSLYISLSSALSQAHSACSYSTLTLLLVCQTFPWLSLAVSSAVTAVWLWLLSSVKSNSKPLAVPQKSLKYRLRWAERETDRIRGWVGGEETERKLTSYTFKSLHSSFGCLS